MYAYNIHFGAKQSVLLYPEMEGSREVRSPYRESEAVKKEFQNHTCSTFFINLFDKDGYINKNAGEDLIKFLCKEGGMNSVKFFTTEEIKQLRQPVILPSKGPRGWSKSQIEPAEVLKAFSALRLKKGFVLRAYQFRGEGGGNAVVWAIPEESPFPSPKCSPKLKDTFLEPLRPPLALDDLMEVIEGDGSHWSYLSASIFMREINEFGALWHGCSWSTHEIIDKAPSDYFNQIQGDSEESVPYTKVEEWEWLERKPKEWQPSVFKNNDKIIVTFYSFSGLGSEAIYRHIDTFQTGKYSFKTKEVLIARGCGGYVF